MKVAVLCGGVGAARFLRGLVSVVPASDVTAVVNVADDLELHGLRISPDLDTVMYTLAGAIDPERGWGLADESWQAMSMFDRYGRETWFSLGDRDLATHVVRTEMLGAGQTLTEVTAELCRSWGVEVRLLPVTDDDVRTWVTTTEGVLSFQEYFVGHRHDIPVEAIEFRGAAAARPGPDVVATLVDADRIVIAPSNPLVSIDPVLAVPGVRDAVRARRDDVVAVSPIVGGAALKGPADRLLIELGHRASAAGVAELYADLAAFVVIDRADEHLADAVADAGVTPIVCDTVMRTVAVAGELAAVTLHPDRAAA